MCRVSAGTYSQTAPGGALAAAHRDPLVGPGDAGTVGGAPPSPPARRVHRPSWRDPRLLVGLAIVAVSVLLGVRLLAAADDTTTVWSAAADLAAGQAVDPGDLESVEVRFGSADLAARYLPATALPPGSVLLADVSSGEMLPRGALGEGAAEDVAELPISLSAESVPVGLEAGRLVDVWVTPADTAAGRAREAVRVLESVPVVAAPESAGALGPSMTRQVVVAVPVEEQAVIARALAALAEGTVVLVGRG